MMKQFKVQTVNVFSNLCFSSGVFLNASALMECLYNYRQNIITLNACGPYFFSIRTITEMVQVRTITFIKRKADISFNMLLSQIPIIICLFENKIREGTMCFISVCFISQFICFLVHAANKHLFIGIIGLVFYLHKLFLTLWHCWEGALMVI